MPVGPDALRLLGLSLRCRLYWRRHRCRHNQLRMAAMETTKASTIWMTMTRCWFTGHTPSLMRSRGRQRSRHQAGPRPQPVLLIPNSGTASWPTAPLAIPPRRMAKADRSRLGDRSQGGRHSTGSMSRCIARGSARCTCYYHPYAVRLPPDVQDRENNR
jgi:hypothetical protein